MRRGMGVGPAFGAILIAGALGAGMALLFAPQSGGKTRAALLRGARRVRGEAEDAARRAADRVADRVADTLDEARDGVERRIQAARGNA
jgi:gas vesicle protein